MREATMNFTESELDPAEDHDIVKWLRDYSRRDIDAMMNEAADEIEQFREGLEGMKEGFAVRVADLEAANARLCRELDSMQRGTFGVVAKLEGEMNRLRAALEPFAYQAEIVDRNRKGGELAPDDEWFRFKNSNYVTSITLGDCRRALDELQKMR